MSNERMHSGPNGKKEKKPYIPPTIIKLPLEKAKQFIMERTHCGDKEALALLDSLRRQRDKQQPKKPSTDDDEWKRSARSGDPDSLASPCFTTKSESTGVSRPVSELGFSWRQGYASPSRYQPTIEGIDREN
jgi:hypothetical protein